MKTAVQSTSIQAYHAIRDDGHECRQSDQVMQAINAGFDYSLRELSQLTGIPVHTVSARVNKLKKDGMLEHANKRRCMVSGVTINPVRLPAGQLELI
jgi:DNA-binding GntR family transcriptional regulator